MSDYRLSKDTSARYTSLEDLRESFGLKPFSKKTQDVNKLKSQQEQFQGKCICCGKPITYIEGTNPC